MSVVEPQKVTHIDTNPRHDKYQDIFFWWLAINGLIVYVATRFSRNSEGRPSRRSETALDVAAAAGRREKSRRKSMSESAPRWRRESKAGLHAAAPGAACRGQSMQLRSKPHDDRGCA